MRLSTDCQLSRIVRNFRIDKRYNIQSQGHLFNGSNRSNYNVMNATVGNKSYGVITGTQSSRIAEFLLGAYF